MERIRGSFAGLLVGLLLSPIFCILTYLVIFFVSILTFTNVPVFKRIHELVCATSHPLVLTVLVSCMSFTLLGYLWKWRFFSRPLGAND